MQLNYYFLKRLVPELRQQIVGATLEACFSQEKDELILGFSRSELPDFYIRATLTSSFSCLSFPEDFKRSRRNSIDLFTQLIGESVSQINLFENERAFVIKFLKHDLVFKLHGNRSNLIAFLSDGKKELFKNKLKGDQALEIASLHRPIDRSFAIYQQNPNFKNFFPTFGAIPAAYLKSKGFEESSTQEQWQMLQELVTQMDTNPYYLIEFQGKPTLSLLAMSNAKKLGNSAIEACNQFFRHFNINYYLTLEKKQVEQELTKRIRQTEGYIKKSESRLEKLKSDIQPDQIADILMANLHQVPVRQKRVTLFDFYHDQDLDIKLNPELNPQKNAEQYYRKSKNRKIEVEKTEANVFSKYEAQEELNRLRTELTQIEDLRTLRKWVKENNLSKISGGTASESVPYKAFEIGNYQIWVGKNAKANDELSLKYAYKEDLWLHTKDVPGSHVLIKDRSGQKTPKEVIEKAAGLAAWYSKRKTDSLVPVIVTAAKFVRKRKGAPPGQVIVSKEDVVLVEPCSPDQL